MPRPPDGRLAIVTERWSTAGEEQRRALRALGGALGRHFDVTVVTPEAGRAGPWTDGIFTVAQTGSACTPALALQRDLILDAFASRPAPPPAPARRWLERLEEPVWAPVGQALREAAPDVVLVAGHRHASLHAVVERAAPDAAVLVAPLLAEHETLAASPGLALLARSRALVVFGPAEAAAVEGSGPGPVHDVGLPGAINPSIWREPAQVLAGHRYAVVLTDSRRPVAEDLVEPLVRLLAGALPARRLAAVYPDRVELWHGGARQVLAAASKAGDRWRLVAWASVAVDLRPGRLLALQSVTALLHGTPVVAPAGTRAAELAAGVGAGTPYRHADELVDAVRGLTVTGPVGPRQGPPWVRSHYGDTEGFLARVAAVAGPVLAA